MIMTSIPSLPPTPPNASPALLPKPSGGSVSPRIPPMPTTHRSYARAPPVRPYQPLLVSRGSKAAKEPERDTKRFGELVAEIVEVRSRQTRKNQGQGDASKSKSVGGSLSGSWEKERAELIVDVPVWSPGCFQDLSTLHALRDTTLSHTHSLLSFLQNQYSLPASYRLLARSATGTTPHPIGWGCIRLAPTSSSPVAPRKELKPLIRRSSQVDESSRPRRRSSMPVPVPKIQIQDQAAEPIPHSGSGESTKRPAGLTSTMSDINLLNSTLASTSVPRGRQPSIGSAVAAPQTAASLSPIPSAMPLPTRVKEAFESAIADDDEDEEVKLKDGYISGSGTVSDEEEEETADETIAKEVEKRGAKEGSAFLMTLFGQPALILT